MRLISFKFQKIQKHSLANASAQNALSSELNAKKSEEKASASEANAKISENNAAASAENIKNSEEYVKLCLGKSPYRLIERIIVGYSYLTVMPDDWSTNYSSYYKNTGTKIEPVYEKLTEYHEFYPWVFFQKKDDVCEIYRSTEPRVAESAVPYKFGHIMIKISALASDEVGLIYVNLKDSENNGKGVPVTRAIDTKPSCSTVECVTSNGITNCVATNSTPKFVSWTRNMYIGNDVSPIGPVTVVWISSGTVPIPAGSVIEIYGTNAFEQEDTNAD